MPFLFVADLKNLTKVVEDVQSELNPNSASSQVSNKISAGEKGTRIGKSSKENENENEAPKKNLVSSDENKKEESEKDAKQKESSETTVPKP